MGAIETLLEVSEKAQFERLIKKKSENYLLKDLKLKSALKDRYKFGNIIGKSQAMQEVYELIVKAAATNANVIIYGESGTGKELIAHAIHDLSPRYNGKFVAVNCGAIPEALVESEFFGYKKGAFTGAYANKPGYLDLADGGTLFLDEAGEISLNMQVKLLRAIESGEFSPVGGSETKKTDMRIVAATSRDLIEMTKKGLMRDDFFYRIHILPIYIPPLRSRKEDIRLLIDYFLKIYTNSNKKPSIPENVRRLINNYDWPGNVRELQNVLFRYITLKQLDFPGKLSSNEDSLNNSISGDNEGKRHHLQKAVEIFERNFISSILDKHHWNKSRAASVMGISRKTLFRKMKSLRLI